jgi:hypothetical protein
MAKVLYEFQITKEVEVEEEKIGKVTNSEGVEVEAPYKEKIKKEFPIIIRINSPTRRQVQECELERSIEFSKLIKLGLLSKAMLLNKYDANGGIVSESDKKIFEEIDNKLKQLQIDLSNLTNSPDPKTDENNNKIRDLNRQIAELRRIAVDKHASYYTLFESTADNKADSKAILWYTLNLTQIKDTSIKNADFVPFFPGKNFEERETKMFDYEENKDQTYLKVSGKLSGLLSYCFYTNFLGDKEAFDNIVNA